MVHLYFKGDVVAKVVAHAHGGSAPKNNVVQYTARVRIDVLIAEIGPNPAQAFRDLRIESRHVIDSRTLVVDMADQESLV